MKRIYEKYRDKEVLADGFPAFVAGYSHNRLILATLEKPKADFRRDEGMMFIDDKYKDSSYRYCYANEAHIEQQLGTAHVELKGIKCEPKEPVNGLVK